MNDNTTIHCTIINQLFNIQQKLKVKLDDERMNRRFESLHAQFGILGYQIHNPIGESYESTRTDCQASIVGEEVNNLFIVEVIKPIIFDKRSSQLTIIQQAVVVVESKK